jgi:hypothetical protein
MNLKFYSFSVVVPHATIASALIAQSKTAMFTSHEQARYVFRLKKSARQVQKKFSTCYAKEAPRKLSLYACNSHFV